MALADGVAAAREFKRLQARYVTFTATSISAHFPAKAIRHLRRESLWARQTALSGFIAKLLICYELLTTTLLLRLLYLDVFLALPILWILAPHRVFVVSVVACCAATLPVSYALLSLAVFHHPDLVLFGYR